MLQCPGLGRGIFLPGTHMRLSDKYTQRWLFALAALATLAAVALAYVPGLTGDFMFDDIPNILNNPFLPLHSLSSHALLASAFSSHSGLLYRPLSMLSFAFNEYLFGPGPYSFKLTNVILHLINALLVLWLSGRLLSLCGTRYQFPWTDAQLRWAAVIIAAAWALHPLNLTAVLYIVQRMTSLAALFTLAGMLAYLYGRERSQSGRSGWPLVWLLTPLFGVIGLFCKEDAALLPLYLLIIEWLIFGFRSQNQRMARNIVVFYLLGLILPGLIGIAYLTHIDFFAAYAGRDFTLSERVLTELRVVLLYIKWTFFPDIRELALFHDDIALSTGLLHPVTTLLSLLALLAILLLAFWQRRRRPLLCLGILWFFAGQLMESTVLPLELAFEHRNYLPDLGLILAFFSLLLLPVAPRSELKLRPSLRWTLAIIIMPVLLSTTLLRAWEWRNPLSFAYYEAHHHPGSQRAQYVLGQAYSNIALAGGLKNPEQALRALAQAAAISNVIMPDVAMMMVSAKLHLPVNPKWTQHALELLRSRAVSVQDVDSLASLVNCIPTDCKGLADETLTLLMAALHPQGQYRHSVPDPSLWVVYGNFLTFTGHPPQEVVPLLQRAVTVDPNGAIYRINLAKGLIVIGDLSGAQQQIDVLRKLNFLGHLDLSIQELETRLATARTAAATPPAKG